MPVIVTTLANQVPVTPVGRPENVAPEAPVVAYVMFVMGVLIQRVWLFVPTPEVSDTVLFGVTFIVPVAFTEPHPPVRGIE